ncbi:MAG: hypothetical protein ACP5KN_01245 [Armatimonadota bacterium]
MSPRARRAELWVVFGLATLLTLGIGLHGRLAEQRVNWDGLAAVAHANDVFRAERGANLAMIGFVQPPLPALLQLPVVLLVPALASSGIAANLLGALAAGAAAALLLGICAETGLRRAWRWPLVALFALHPMVLGPAACGAPMALLTALLLGAAWALLRWSQSEGLRELITASVLLAAALITRYEAIFIVAGALIYLAWRTLRGGGSWSKLEGTLITFGLPIAYVAGVWVIANWAIMGDPWHFLRETFASRGGADAAEMLSSSLRLTMVWFFPALALVYNQMRGVGRRPAAARPVAWLVMTAILAPALFPAVFASLGPAGDWSRLVTVLAMVLAGGYVMLAALLGERLRGEADGAPMHGTLVIAAASLGVAIWLAGSGGLLASAGAAYRGSGPLTASARAELSAAGLLRDTELPPGRKHVIVGWPGFAVVLFSGRTGEMAVLRTEDLPEHRDELWAGSRIVILVGEQHGGVPPTVVQDDLGLGPRLELQPRWGAGPWECYVVSRSSR